jgi:Flp pilus assembly protein TadD
VATWRELASRPTPAPEPLFNLGRLLLARGRTAEARATLERATVLRPNLVPAWYRLAEACRVAGDRAGEQAALRRALAVDPGEREVYLALAAALAADGRASEADSLLRFAKTVARRPDAIPEPAPLEP